MKSAAFFSLGFVAAAAVTVLVDRLLNPEPRVEPMAPAPFYSHKTEVSR